MPAPLCGLGLLEPPPVADCPVSVGCDMGRRLGASSVPVVATPRATRGVGAIFSGFGLQSLKLVEAAGRQSLNYYTFFGMLFEVERNVNWASEVETTRLSGNPCQACL
eukprot:4060180-Amphidinium_carterae.2